MSQKTKKEKMRRPDDGKKAMSSSKTINNKGKNSTREIDRFVDLSILCHNVTKNEKRKR
jgi:hypothetical protein